MAIHNRITYPVESIREAIAQGSTHARIAARLAATVDPRITPKLIYKICKKHGIRCQRTGPRSGEGHPEWRGGRIVTKLGYVKTYCPEHPTCERLNARRAEKADGRYFRRQRYVWEHRLVMENKLGRFLRDNEVVHHINGVKSDNREENLMLFQSNADHLAFDLKGKCPNWSEEGKAVTRAAIEKWRAMRRRLKGQDALQTQQTLAPQSF